MNLYDGLIAQAEKLLAPFADRRKGGRLDAGSPGWEQEAEQRILFQKDTAYELGGGGRPAYSGAAFTSDAGIGDEVWVYGPDLSQIREDCAYARLTLLRVDDSAWAGGQQTYRTLRRLEYTRYHVCPKGFMMRISAAQNREVVRVGREALREGLTFARVGSLFAAQYHRHPEVLGVRILFVTEPAFPYEEFARISRLMDGVTESLNEIYNHLVMDCSSCRLKPVCDEVEGLRSLHFSQQ